MQQYEADHDSIDAVVLDLTMPVMDGEECFRRLRRIDPAARVIVCTGHALDETAQRLLDEGAIRVIQKPFVREELSQAVAEALGD